jgi:hypothetical protein
VSAQPSGDGSRDHTDAMRPRDIRSEPSVNADIAMEYADWAQPSADVDGRFAGPVIPQAGRGWPYDAPGLPGGSGKCPYETVIGPLTVPAVGPYELSIWIEVVPVSSTL